MTTYIKFPEGEPQQVTKRTDLEKDPLQELLRKFWRHSACAICQCRVEVELKMKIVRKPTCGKAKVVGTTPPSSAGGEVSKAAEAEFYLRRDHKTIDQHAPGCPFVLALRDKSKVDRVRKKIPTSAFGPQRHYSEHREYSLRSGGAFVGKNLGKFNDFCNDAINETCYLAAMVAGYPFGVPTIKVFLSCLGNQILTCKDMAEAGATPFDAAIGNGCRLEFGLCSFDGFDGPFPISSDILQMPLVTAEMDESLRSRSYTMDEALFKRTARHVRRRNHSLKPPYVWIGITSPGNRLERIWLWSVVVRSGRILIVDSEPESLFAANAIRNGRLVYKVRSVDDANLLIKWIAPDAPLLLTKCDYLTWNGRILKIVEVVRCPLSDDEYWTGLRSKEHRRGGYLKIKEGGKMDYLRADMNLPLTKHLFAEPDLPF